jgi:hypothetical protein
LEVTAGLFNQSQHVSIIDFSGYYENSKAKAVSGFLILLIQLIFQNFHDTGTEFMTAK